MKRLVGIGLALLSGLLLTSCATSQSRATPLAAATPPKPADFVPEVYRTGRPARPFVPVARLDVHLEKTHLLSSNFDDALPQLLERARQSGADAIIDIRETRAVHLETRVYHVTAIGVRYKD